MIRTIEFPSARAEQFLARLEARSEALFDGEAAAVAARAIREVRRGGDRALKRWVRRIDKTKGPLRVRPGREKVAREFARAVDLAIRRVEEFARGQLLSPARVGRRGSRLEESVRPLDSVAVYVPGGRAAYLSTAVMGVVPARVAGVGRIVVATPGRAYDASPELRWTLRRLGVEEVYRMGGAHGVAALAFGTESIEPVDKLVGPGNRYVTAAKRLLVGRVGIDGLAGPTEVVVLADETAEADWIAADLLAQAEHDPDAAAIAVVTSLRLAAEIGLRLSERLQRLSTKVTAAVALKNSGAIVTVREKRLAFRFVDRVAPEHLQIMTQTASADARRVGSAGAIFVGGGSAEVFGDYIAGSSHILPTNRSARYASALSTRDFLRVIPIIVLSEREVELLAKPAALLAEAEGLPGHAAAALARGGRRE